MAKLCPKTDCPVNVLELVNNSLFIDVDGERTTIILDQVRVYMFREGSEKSKHFSDNVSQLIDFLLYGLTTVFILAKVFPIEKIRNHQHY